MILLTEADYKILGWGGMEPALSLAKSIAHAQAKKILSEFDKTKPKRADYTTDAEYYFDFLAYYGETIEQLRKELAEAEKDRINGKT
jgi:hypothetical protein